MAGLALPSLPTDNLYKFAALAGIAIVVSTVYLLVSQTLNIVDRVTDAREAGDTAIARHNFIVKRAQDFKELLDNSIAAKKGTLKKDSQKLDIGYSDDEIKATEKSLKQAEEDLDLEVVKVKYALERSKLELVAGICLLVLGCLVNAIGWKLATWGFRCWYWRIQVPLDEQFRKKLGSVESSDATGEQSQVMGQDDLESEG
jgi:hypothetical protein